MALYCSHFRIEHVLGICKNRINEAILATIQSTINSVIASSVSIKRVDCINLVKTNLHESLIFL